LNDIVDQTTGLRMHRAAERADYARSHARLETERVANRYCHLPDAQAFGIGQTYMGELGRIDPDHSKISVGIVADELRRTVAAIREVHPDPGGMMDDMAVGQNEAVRRNHKSGSASGNIPRPIFDALLDLDVHNGGRDPRDCAYD
jgi:hypothetical protein